jgi:hypothetical protein
MAYELSPKADRRPLPMDAIVRLLQNSFAHVELDVERASRSLQESARHMARTGPPHFSKEDIERERGLIGRAVFVVLADDPKTDLAYLDFMLEPDHEKILIGYESRMHEEASRGLRERLAQVLDYEIELV